jgi:DNA-binding FadR family transcriptional regulator
MQEDQASQGAQGALTQLRAYLSQEELASNARLPAERELSDLLGVSRGDLRKALAILEREGELWRHVGKGTFVGPKPIEDRFSIAGVSGLTNPAEVMRTRLLIEPQIAREAALHANSAEIAEMRACLKSSRQSRTWRQYENFDNRLHRLIAQATHNTLLLALFDTLNAVRRAVVWGRLREHPVKPPSNHHSFAEHEALVKAIEERDLDGAEGRMRQHLQSVRRNLTELREAAE